MRLSILDQSPVAQGKTEQDALQESIKLAQLGEKLGYYRYWIAEHHDLKGLACPAPEVMLGVIGSQTNSIRIGAGAVLLPHYKPYKVAETFNVLATLYPGRIDLGIGRSPGGSAEASMALSDNFLENVKNMPKDLDELVHFIKLDFPDNHMFSKLKPTPVPKEAPVPWLLGTSGKSATLAAEKGLPYTFGHFMSEADGPKIVEHYCKEMEKQQRKPHVIVAISAYCADTTKEAEELVMKQLITSVYQSKGEPIDFDEVEQAKRELTNEDYEQIEEKKKRIVIGTPNEVGEQIKQLQKLYQVDEFMILTNTADYETRRKSYELIASKVL